MDINNFILNVGDLVVSRTYRYFEGFPYVIKVLRIDENSDVIHFNFKGEQMYISVEDIRPATKFEIFFGPIYDYFIK